MISKNLRIAAAIIAIIYMLVQSFQWWVFAKVPDTDNVITSFLNGANKLNIYRSWFMLISMFGLMFVYFIICFANYYNNKAWSVLAFWGFFIFLLLEVILRSVELFYFQYFLPAEYVHITSAESKSLIIFTFTAFQHIQSALYFPLMFSALVGSVILFFTYSATPRINTIIKIAFLVNALRLIFRMLDVYFGIHIYNDALDTTIYLPLVYLLFGLKAFWLFKTAKPIDSPSYT